MIGKNVELFEVPVASYDGRQREADQGIVWITPLLWFGLAWVYP